MPGHDDMAAAPHVKGKRPGARPGLLLSDWTHQSASIVIFHRDILAGVVRHHARGNYAHHGTGGDVDRDRVAGVIAREQGGSDQRRWTAGDDRRELITE